MPAWRVLTAVKVAMWSLERALYDASASSCHESESVTPTWSTIVEHCAKKSSQFCCDAKSDG
jgi:hypothetical protein